MVAEIGKRAEEATPGEAAGRPATVAIPLASPGAAVRARLSLVRWGAQGRSYACHNSMQSRQSCARVLSHSSPRDMNRPSP